MSQATFYYSERCGACVATLRPVLQHLVKAGIPLIVRKPNISEAKQLKGYPAIYLPDGTVIVGTGMIEEVKRRYNG